MKACQKELVAKPQLRKGDGSAVAPQPTHGELLSWWLWEGSRSCATASHNSPKTRFPLAFGRGMGYTHFRLARTGEMTDYPREGSPSSTIITVAL